MIMPGSSRQMASSKRMPSGMGNFTSVGDVPNMLSQNMSETLILFSGSTLCASQCSNGPKKFQFGPRRNVPNTINVVHKTMKPNWNVVTANQRFLNEK